MKKTIQAVRGIRDLVPGETEHWAAVEAVLRGTLESYGYREIRLPVLEHTELFQRTIGEATDIVEKEMYTFEDRNGERLTLRPEGTAGCARACLEHGLIHNQLQRLWYIGPMFRRERPQKGRFRQFYQIGAEAFGMPGPDIDAELVAMTARFWRGLDLKGLRLEINSLGTPAVRECYRRELVAFLQARKTELDEDSQRRLTTNPLRILDSKSPATQAILADAPLLSDYLDERSRAHFQGLLDHLQRLGVAYKVNPRLVRGLDYYSLTVFEWVTEELGAQGTVCAGGRYDGLVEQLGGRATPAVGFALGLDRLVALLSDQRRLPEPSRPHVYLVADPGPPADEALRLAERLRDEVRGMRLILNCGGGSFKSQLKRADRSGAAIALILGENEYSRREVAVKWLREQRPQESVPWSQLTGVLANTLPR